MCSSRCFARWSRLKGCKPTFSSSRRTRTLRLLYSSPGAPACLWMNSCRWWRAISERSAPNNLSWNIWRPVGWTQPPDAQADPHAVKFTENLLASAIGAPSSRLVMSLMLRRLNLGREAALRLLDEASEAVQYNRDLLQTALDHVRQGIAVFDKKMQLICWNRQFRELLMLPQQYGRVGAPLDEIVRFMAHRVQCHPTAVEELVTDRILRIPSYDGELSRALHRRPRRRGPYQCHAAWRHCRDLYRHHGTGGCGGGTRPRQREPRKTGRSPHARTRNRQGQGRRGQHLEDAVSCRRQPRRSSAIERRPPLRLKPH